MTKTPMEIAMDEKYLIPLRHYCKKAPLQSSLNKKHMKLTVFFGGITQYQTLCNTIN